MSLRAQSASPNDVLTRKIVAGDVLAGVWQFMNQPWSSFREIVFDIVLAKQGWEYIGYGRFDKFIPPPRPEPSLSLGGSSDMALNKVE